MTFDHEKLDVYQVSLASVAWSYTVSKCLSGPDRHARDQLLRASQSIRQNIAQGNGKRVGADRQRFFEIARGSAVECAAILDILAVRGGGSPEDAEVGKGLLHRIVSMLVKLGARVAEVRGEYWVGVRGIEGENENEDERGDGGRS